MLTNLYRIYTSLSLVLQFMCPCSPHSLLLSAPPLFVAKLHSRRQGGAFFVSQTLLPSPLVCSPYILLMLFWIVLPCSLPQFAYPSNNANRPFSTPTKILSVPIQLHPFHGNLLPSYSLAFPLPPKWPSMHCPAPITPYSSTVSLFGRSLPTTLCQNRCKQLRHCL
jgi:hypothetical protein